MKLIALTVVSFAVFTVNCRDRDISDGGPKEHFEGGPADHGFSGDVDDGFQIEQPVLEQVHGEAEIPSTDTNEILQDERKLRGAPKCKSDIVCSLLGGSCLNNSTNCNGREVPSVCSGSTCRCCIAVNLEVKIHDLETELRSMVVNLTIVNSNLDTKMEALMDFLISANSSQAIINSNLNRKLDSLSSNFTDANSAIENDLQFIKENMTNANANQELKLDYIRDYHECPKGLFLYAKTNQCFKLMNDTSRNWYSANTTCHAMGLELAQPFDPVSLRSFLISKYGWGGSNYYWIGAKGDGSNIRWQRTGKYISTSSPLWYSGQPSSRSSSYCLMMPVYESAWKSYPGGVYYSSGCGSRYHALCELRRE